MIKRLMLYLYFLCGTMRTLCFAYMNGCLLADCLLLLPVDLQYFIP